MLTRAAHLTAAAAVVLLPALAQSSSHREAPGITELPKADSTDLYAFMSYEPGREGYVTFIANYQPFQDPFGGPNYFMLDEDASYDIHIDSDGDALADIRFRFDFDNTLVNIRLPVGPSQIPIPLAHVGPLGAGNTAALNVQETYQVFLERYGPGNTGLPEVLTNAADGSKTFTKPYDFAGTKTFGSVEAYENYARQYIYTVNIPGCDRTGRVFVGQRDETFQINVGKIFDLVNLVPVEAGAVPNLPGIAQDPENDELANKNITSIALEVWAGCVKGRGNGVIGVWQIAQLPQARVIGSDPSFDTIDAIGGPLQQVSRLGMPLVNELVIGLPDKNRFNSNRPSKDARFLAYVTNPTLPAILDTLFRTAVNQATGQNLASLAPSNIPRNDLVTTFLTGFPGLNQLAQVTPSEMQRLNTAVPATPAASQNPLGVIGGDLAGFPNGRRLGDDVVDIELRVAMGRLCHPLPGLGQLGLCTPAQAPVGTVPFTDGAPTSAQDYDTRFPYARAPLPGDLNFPRVR